MKRVSLALLLLLTLVLSLPAQADPYHADIEGDANDDLKIDGSDITILAGNWQIGVVAADASEVGVAAATAENEDPPVIPGDANFDGRVDGCDLTILACNWSGGIDPWPMPGWTEGDFNGDGKVDGSDVTILAGNWQFGVALATTAVPEPSSLVLLLSIVALGVFSRRAR